MATYHSIDVDLAKRVKIEIRSITVEAQGTHTLVFLAMCTLSFISISIPSKIRITYVDPHNFQSYILLEQFFTKQMKNLEKFI